jgi:superfamily II DNA/RNA helicase
VSEAISEIVQDACQIVMKTEELKLENLHQFYYKCKPKGKIDFLMDLF